MPFFRLETNLGRNKIPSSFVHSMSKVIASALNKPESRVSVCIVPDLIMSFGGSPNLCGNAYLMSIGNLGVEENKKISACLADHVERELGIPNDRMYIEFCDKAPSDVGSTGTTVQEIRAQTK